MRLHILRVGACLFLLSMLGAAGLHAQAVAEYGMTTTVPATTATAAGKAMVPFPKVTLPGDGSSSAGPGLTSAGPTVAPEVIAKDNMQFFESHAGADAASLTVRSMPDHASVWVDGKYLGPAPVNVKLAPGHHQALVRAPNMQESARAFDVEAKQAQSLDFALKPSFQNQVMIQWPSQKK